MLSFPFSVNSSKHCFFLKKAIMSAFFVFQTTAVAMARSVRERFFVGVMEPQLMQT